MEQQTTTEPMPQPQADEAAPKIWPWLTERRAFIASWVMFGLAVAFRMGWVPGWQA